MTEPSIAFQITDRIARITFARPGARNAMNGALVAAFAEAAEACAADPSLVAIVLAGQGPWFSAGGDLREFLANRDTIAAHVRETADRLHAAILALRRAAAPVIAAVHGVAAGAGFSLICGADLVVAAESARFVSAYTGSGLTPDGGGTFFLPRVVGIRAAFDLMATNPVLSAAEARALGIVSRVVPDDRLAAEVDGIVASLAALAPGAIAGMKALLRRGEDGLAAQLDAERDAIAAQAATPAALARIEAFLNPKPR